MMRMPSGGSRGDCLGECGASGSHKPQLDVTELADDHLISNGRAERGRCELLQLAVRIRIARAASNHHQHGGLGGNACKAL